MLRSPKCVVALGITLLYFTSASAAPDARQESELEVHEVAPKKSKKRNSTNETDVRVHSSLFAIADARKRPNKDSRYDMQLKGARVGIEYKVGRWLESELEVDFSDGSKLRDAYLRAGSKDMAVRIGRFKSSSSALLTSSRWRLPSASRGLVGKILKDEFLLGGRLTGAQLEWQHRGRVDWRATAGGFLPTDTKGKDQSQAGTIVPTVSTRLEGGIEGVRVGVFVARRATSMEESTAYQLSHGADVSVDLPVGNHRLRVWGEGVTGSRNSPMDPTQPALFASLRVLGAIRFRVAKKPRIFIEPFARLGMVDPDQRHRGDPLQEVSAGIGLGVAKNFRLTIQAAQDDTSPFTKEVVSAKSRRSLTVFSGAVF